VQAAVHVPTFCSVSVVQAFWSLHEVGHAPAWPAGIAVSQVSPESTTPLPQAGVGGASQSLSGGFVQLLGQQPSPLTHAVIGEYVQAAVQVPAFCSVSVVQAFWSLHEVGQAPGLPAWIAVSQVSPCSTLPLPQTAAAQRRLQMLGQRGWNHQFHQFQEEW
jgi:hypothetical protein